MTDDKLRAALDRLPKATCYRNHTQPDEHLGVSGAVWIADAVRALAASATDEDEDGSATEAIYQRLVAPAPDEPYDPNDDPRPFLAASADEGPRCPTCNSGQYRQPLCSDPWHAARPAVPETLDVERHLLRLLDDMSVLPPEWSLPASVFARRIREAIAIRDDLRSKESA